MTKLSLIVFALLFATIKADLKTDAEWAGVDELRDCVHEYDQVVKAADASKYVDDDTERKTALEVFEQRFECIDLYKKLADEVSGSRVAEVEDLGYQLYDTEENLEKMWENFQNLKKSVNANAQE